MISDTLTLAERALVRLPRNPDMLLAFTVQPIMFVLLFAFVFGGAIETPGYGDYIEPIRANFPGTLGIDAKPVITDEDIQRWVDWLDSRGDIDAEDIDVKDVYTNELNPNA